MNGNPSTDVWLPSDPVFRAEALQRAAHAASQVTVRSGFQPMMWTADTAERSPWSWLSGPD